MLHELKARLANNLAPGDADHDNEAMPRPDTVTASEIADFVYCPEAWQEDCKVVAWWGEDRPCGRRPGLGERLAITRDTAFATLRLVHDMPRTLPARVRADHLGRSPRKVFGLFGTCV